MTDPEIEALLETYRPEQRPLVRMGMAIAALAIEAQRAETTKIGSVEDESAVQKGDAQ